MKIKLLKYSFKLKILYFPIRTKKKIMKIKSVIYKDNKYIILKMQLEYLLFHIRHKYYFYNKFSNSFLEK